MALRVYNTLSRKKETFEPVEPGKVGIYVCGPTVYMPSHVGHMVGPVIFDCVKRYLTYLGYQVTLVVNITDVEDKLIARAQQEGTSVADLARRVTEDYVRNLQRLRVDTIDHMPYATEHVGEIVALTKSLVDKGYAYVANGDVYFDVTKDGEYGKLSKRKPDEMQAGARIEVSERKKSAMDFALWKGAKPGEPAWDSPWGQGRPGWHIECSAMSMKYLGEHFDIHGGGLDLVFPHHENEVAQSECATGKPFARYWMHNGLMQMTGDKMSKSKGNLVTITELLNRYEPETIRFFLLATHYRRPIDFSDEHIQEVGRGLDRFYRYFERYERTSGESVYALPASERKSDAPLAGKPESFFAELEGHRARFLEAMDDDFNTGAAVGVLYDLLGSLNAFVETNQMDTQGKGDGTLQGALRRGTLLVRELAGILGVFRRPREQRGAIEGELTAPLLDLLVALRGEARQQRNFAMADHVRDGLARLGVTLEDRADGTVWRIG